MSHPQPRTPAPHATKRRTASPRFDLGQGPGDPAESAQRPGLWCGPGVASEVSWPVGAKRSQTRWSVSSSAMSVKTPSGRFTSSPVMTPALSRATPAAFRAPRPASPKAPIALLCRHISASITAIRGSAGAAPRRAGCPARASSPTTASSGRSGAEDDECVVLERAGRRIGAGDDHLAERATARSDDERHHRERLDAGHYRRECLRVARRVDDDAHLPTVDRERCADLGQGRAGSMPAARSPGRRRQPERRATAAQRSASMLARHCSWRARTACSRTCRVRTSRRLWTWSRSSAPTER